jgi:esterase/lipase superfamily enzyme
MTSFNRILAFFLISFLWNCPKQPDLSELLNNRIQNPYDSTSNLNIYFSTIRKDRPLSSRGCSNNYFSPQSGNQLRFGNCEVSVPAEHSIGSLDYSPLGSQEKYFKLQALTDFDETGFYNQIAKSPSKELIVFIHGFNVGFEEAILRASQIKYDMKYQGDIIIYSWPAGGEDESFLGQLFMKGIYESNFQNAVNSRMFFRSFIDSLEKTGKDIHLIVHSMGHQVVLPILAVKAEKAKNPFLKELILNAPDYDKKEFTDIAGNIILSSQRVTLYCSPGDNALIASQRVNGAARVGMCSRYPGIDVINVNEVDDPVLGIGGLGHGYYSSRAILTDIYQVILGISVEKRLFIRKSGQYNSEDFVLRK